MKRRFIGVITILVLMLFCGSVEAKYMVNKDLEFEFNTEPFYFNAEAVNSNVVMDTEGATVELSIKNFNEDSLYNNFDTQYEILLEDTSKFAFSSKTTVSGMLSGGNKIEDKIEIRLIPLQADILNSEEKVTIKITAINPYKKEIDIPITINTNPSTLSGMELNFLIKNGTYAPEGDVYEYYSEDSNRLKDETVKKIVFGKYNEYKSDVTGITAEPLDVNKIGIINLYRKLNTDNTTYTIYILSQDGTFELSENAAWTFDKLYALESIENLHLVDTSKVVNMRDMFCDCAALKTVDLSNFETSKVTDMIGMFARMTEIQYLDLLSFDTSSVTKINQMFTTDKNLKAIYVSDKWNLSNVEEGTGMFTACTNLVGQNGTALDTTKISYEMAVIDGSSKGYLSGEYYLLEGVTFNAYVKGKTDTDLNSWTTSTRFTDTEITNITFGKTRDYYKIVEEYTGTAVDMRKAGGVQIYRVPNGNSTYTVYVISNSGIFNANPDNSWMFDKLYMLSTITNLNLLNTSNVTTMRDMFCDCASLKSIDFSNFDTSKVTSFEGMFARMYTIQELDLSTFNTAKATTMNNMIVLSVSATETISSFQNAIPALKTIYVSSLWNTSGVPTTQTVFTNCVNLVGGNGTVFNSNNLTVNYACVDTSTTPGYLTLKK